MNGKTPYIPRQLEVPKEKWKEARRITLMLGIERRDLDNTMLLMGLYVLKLKTRKKMISVRELVEKEDIAFIDLEKEKMEGKDNENIISKKKGKDKRKPVDLKVLDYIMDRGYMVNIRVYPWVYEIVERHAKGWGLNKTLFFGVCWTIGFMKLLEYGYHLDEYLTFRNYVMSVWGKKEDDKKVVRNINDIKRIPVAYRGKKRE